MLVMLYYIIDFMFLNLFLSKFRKTGNKDYWFKFKALFFTNFLLLYIGYGYFVYSDLGTLDMGLLIMFIFIFCLMINILMGFIGFFTRKIMIKNNQYDYFLELESKFPIFINFIKIVISFAIVILISNLLNNIFEQRNINNNNSKIINYLNKKYGYSCEFYGSKENISTYDDYEKFRMYSNCVENSFFVDETDNTSSRYQDDFLENYYYGGNYSFDSEYKKDEQKIDDGIASELEKLSNYLNDYVTVSLDNSNGYYSYSDCVPKDYGKIPTKTELYNLILQKVLEKEIIIRIDVDQIDNKLYSMEEAKEVLKSLKQDSKYTISNLGVYKNGKIVKQYSSELELLNNLLLDINVLTPEIESELIEYYKKIALLISDFYPDMKSLEFTCNYGKLHTAYIILDPENIYISPKYSGDYKIKEEAEVKFERK